MCESGIKHTTNLLLIIAMRKQGGKKEPYHLEDALNANYSLIMIEILFWHKFKEIGITIGTPYSNVFSPFSTLRSE
jgi:hypothetical protein